MDGCPINMFAAVVPVGAISLLHPTKFWSMAGIELSLEMIHRTLHCLLKRYANIQGVEHLTL